MGSNKLEVIEWLKDMAYDYEKDMECPACASVYHDILRLIEELEAKNSKLTIDLTHEVGHRCAAEAKLADWENSMKHALDPCPDEKHCACVPFLRKRINELEAELSALRDVTAEYWQTLCHYDHDDISTPFERFANGPMPSRDERYHQLCEDRNDAIQDKGWAELKLARVKDHVETAYSIAYVTGPHSIVPTLKDACDILSDTQSPLAVVEAMHNDDLPIDDVDALHGWANQPGYSHVTVIVMARKEEK